MLAVVDLFSGPGGLSLGFKRAGFKLVVAVECDRWAAETYKNNFAGTELIKEDIKMVDGDRLLDIVSRFSVDGVVLIGGPPCQPFSRANRQTNGSNHPSASTVDHFVRLIEEMMPDGFLFENVTTFEHIDKGKSMKMFAKDIKKLGYRISIAKLDFEEFSIPQHRQRLFIGGIKGDNCATFDLSSVRRSGAKITVRDAISDLPPLEDGGGGKDEADYLGEKDLTDYQKKARAGSERLYNHWSSRHSDPVIQTISYIKQGSSLRGSWNCLPDSIKTRYNNYDGIHSNIYYRLTWDDLSRTIVHPRRAMLLHPEKNRIITVREAARLQNFPDKFRFYGGLNSQYQQVANAVPPGVAEALGRLFLKHFNRLKKGKILNYGGV